MNLSTRILIGLGLGLILGIMISDSQNQNLISLPIIIEPIGDLWVNAIRMTIIPLLIALLITAIAGQKNSEIAAKLGGKTIAVFVVMIIASSLFTLILAPILLSFISIDPEASKTLLSQSLDLSTSNQELPPFRDWLVGLIPTNPFRAANDNAVLPLLIFIGLFAISLLHIKESQRQIIVDFFEAVKSAMFVLINWIMAVAPIGVFALVLPLAANLGFSAITSLGSFVIITCGLITLMTVLLYPLATILGRLKIGEFVKALAPVQVIGFSTRSSLASLPATIAATEKLGVSNKVAGVVLPLAVSLFKFASPIARTAGTYFIANLYSVELSLIDYSIIALVIGLLSFYSPGIPSGGLLIMTPVYTSLGLPVQGIGLLIAVDLIIDMFITAANVTANVTVAAVLSRSDR
jgi:Na+/H+-dicarboxylate symporter